MNLEMIEQKTGRKFEKVETVKTNGVVRVGVRVLDSTSNIVPILYQDKMTDEQFAIFVANEYSNYEVPYQEVDFVNKEYVLHNVVPALINTELNTGKLTEWVNRGFCDLTIIYKVNVGEGAFTLTFDMLKHIDATIGEVHTAAMKNLKFHIIDMADILVRNGYPEEPGMRGTMIVLTNPSRIYGASSVLNKEALNSIYSHTGSFYIIPSSVHEVICMPKFTDDVAALKEMVKVINNTEVPETDKLSDNIYEYDGKVVSMIEVA
jgi:hypothetical protein